MKKPKVICDHYHLCKDIPNNNGIFKCMHEESHKYDTIACGVSKCDFLVDELGDESYVHCNTKQLRKDKLKKLNEIKN